MFFPSNRDDVESMSALEIAKMIESMIDDSDFMENVAEAYSEKQFRKAMHSVEMYIRTSDITKVDPETLVAFRRGILYGLGLGAKMSVIEREHREPKDLTTVKKFLFIFQAIDFARKKWKDDKWFENLMSTAVVEPEPIKNKKKSK